MPLIDDLISSDKISGETFSASLGKLDIVSKEVAERMFPGVKLANSPNITYFPFRLCHSLPNINDRGRAFSPVVLANSFDSLNDQLIDWDHYLEENDIGRDDRIIGHVKTTRFDMPETLSKAISNIKEVADTNSKMTKFREMASLTEAVPVIGLGALFNRAKGVQEAVKNHVAKLECWSVSMECGHKWKDAVLMYRGEFIPVPDAENAMRDCIQADHIKPYKGHPLAACLGGLDGKVNFWGMGLTQNPADKDAGILNLFAGTNEELASRKIFYMPLYAIAGGLGDTPEVASKNVDTIIKDLGSIGMIGCTDPAGEDKHVHPILSNLTVVPHNGHGHHLSAVHIKRGTKPMLTGHTSEHYEPSRDYASSASPESKEVSSGKSHLHTVAIPLLGKFSPPESSPLDGPAYDYFNAEESNMKTLGEILKQLNELASNFSKATEQTQRDKLMSDIASTTAEASKLFAAQDIEQSKKDFLAAEIAAGRVVTKEVKDKEVADAVAAETKKLTEQQEAQRKADGIRASRIQKCTELGIDLDVEFEGVKDPEGNALTVRKKVELLPVDDAGEQEFSLQAAMMKSSPLFLKKEEKTPEQLKLEQEQQLAEAANRGSAGKKVARVIPVGGPAGGTETTTTEVASTTKKPVGKSKLRATTVKV